MKKFIIIAALLAFMVGCASKNQDTTDKQEQTVKDSEVVKDIGTRAVTRP